MSIYFVRREDGIGPIRIGCSANPTARLAQLQTSSPFRLAIVAVANGGFNLECMVHRALAKHRLTGEWFNDDPEVLSFLEHVQSLGELPALSPDSPRDKAIFALHKEGKSLRAIAQQFMVSHERVRQIIQLCKLAESKPFVKKAKSPSENNGWKTADRDQKADLLDRVRERGIAIGLSIEELCVMAEVAPSAAQRWRRGSAASLSTIGKLERTLDQIEAAQ